MTSVKPGLHICYDVMILSIHFPFYVGTAQMNLVDVYLKYLHTACLYSRIFSLVLICNGSVDCTCEVRAVKILGFKFIINFVFLFR